MNKITFLLIISFILLNASKVSSQGVGDDAPDFTVTLLDDSQFKLSDNVGKVVFIYLFGNTCPACIANGGSTQTGIYNEFKDNSNFVAIAIDTWNGDKSTVQDFADDVGITYSVGLNGSGVQSDYGTTWDRIMVIDQEGKISYKPTGNVSSTTISNAKSTIEELLNPTNDDTPTDIALSAGDLGAKELISIYPVPAGKQVFIKGLDASANGAIAAIYNLSGKLLFKSNTIDSPSSGELEIPLENLNNGIYLLKITTNNNILTRKIVIKN